MLANFSSFSKAISTHYSTHLPSIRVMLRSPVFYSFDTESSVEEPDWLLAKMRQAIISNPLVNKNITNSHTASVYLASLRTSSWSPTLNIPSALTCQFRIFASSQSSKGTTKHNSENLPRSRRKKEKPERLKITSTYRVVF